MIRENLYEVLGLPNFASLDEIKKAFRSLAFKHHPDKGGNPETMKLISAAYDILSKKKEEYDARLKQVGRPIIIVKTWHYRTGATDSTATGTAGWGWTFNANNY